MNNKTTVDDLLTQVVDKKARYEANPKSIRIYDLVELLLEIKEYDENQFLLALKTLKNDLLAEIIAEFDDSLQEEVSQFFGKAKLAKVTTEMDSDDAADFIQNISETNAKKAEEILLKIGTEDQEVIRSLISYEDGTAGSYMQSELFSVEENVIVSTAFQKLRQLKLDGQIDSISQVFIVNSEHVLLGVLGLEDLIMLSPDATFSHSVAHNQNLEDMAVYHHDSIDEAVDFVSRHNLSVVPVVDEKGKLLGRITSDDIYDIIEDKATDDIFHLAGVDADAENADNISKVFVSRASWLGVNLLTAIAASAVVAFYDATIQNYVALAVLMPIVASMGGNAGTQSLTVTVRQLSIGHIDFADASPTILKEVMLSLVNGALFALIIGIATQVWFGLPNLGFVIAASTVINLLAAGFFGAVIPIGLDKIGVDPAVASTVLLTTITDIVGFLSFLALAQLAL